ncbi:MAG TPA: hypothetical protein VHY91_27050 [Pirellulales bacterium]|nr:hypothetical protein [Pirellulales bacterium]
MNCYEKDSNWSDEPQKLPARELLQWTASFSSRAEAELSRIEREEAEAKAKARYDIELLEFVAAISGKPEHERQLIALLQKEAEEREAQERRRLAQVQVTQEVWDSSKHPRGGFPQNRGWWLRSGGGAGGAAQVPSSFGPAKISNSTHAAGSGSSGWSASPDRADSVRDGSTGVGPFKMAAYRPGGASIKLTAAPGGAAAGNWPIYDPKTSVLPKIEGAAGAAGVVARIGAAGFAAALRNASMIRYWERVPATQVMPEYWAYELDKRVRAGTLSPEDAIGIFSTAVLGARQKGFKPTGNIMSAVHKSIMDFLGEAEEVYFARKKETGWATQPGGYQQSGGRVFPTKKNSGLDRYALRQEQEKFFERGLSLGKLPGELRGQAAVAGSKRANSPDDHLIDPEAEAALQRAIRNAAK